jgi:hypothetical protein
VMSSNAHLQYVIISPFYLFVIFVSISIETNWSKWSKCTLLN